MGRPPEEVPEDVAEELLEFVANGGAVRTFCRKKGAPSKSTVYNWRVKDAEFAGRFARARECGADDKFEEAEEVARSTMPGQTITDDDGKKKVVTEDMLGHRKLLVETLMKMAACYNPARYGQKAMLEHSGSIGFEQLVRDAAKKVESGG